MNLFTGRSALYVREGMKHRLPHNLTSAFASVDRVATIQVRRHGALLREWQVFLCRNYHTLPL